ncbi:endoplasmic reticulum lectin 1-like [Haliotis rubra]|uniref:endoplasmic reticulum lectin 1-like n=1 Tax=Haliotis rubra TaxID=36100 RepID=UPI001EE5FA9A|nr:endoplasmic reticulum lectin 1-like [Haliotis rubra]
MNLYTRYAFVFLFSISTTVGGDFDPFMDAELFKIIWPGSSEIDIEKTVDESRVVVMTTNKERYQCILPESHDKRDSSKADYGGQTADELMNILFTQTTCSYRIESYWTYELCHGKHLRQYHETKDVGQKPKVQEYFLGYGKQDKNEDSESSNIKIRKVEGISLPYYEVNMTDGTACDLTQEPRRTRILYVCQPDGHGEIYEFKETSTCEYEMMVLTSVLCGHPDFRPKNAPVGEIQCHALDGSPAKPTQLKRMEKTVVHTRTPSPEPTPQPTPQAVPDNVATKVPPQYVEQHNLGSTTDKQLLREFLTGEYCLKGGQGWWKYEFCYGIYARQFHDDSQGRTVINLGVWKEAAHLQWLQQNTQKRPREIGKRKFISLFYSDGDICDITGKPRTVEVKLKCVVNTNHPHSVGIYLMEPSTCSYILGIESPIFCSLLDKADDNGILRSIET